MRILLDECIDERFRNSLPAHDCQTARYAALAGLENGELLAAAEKAKFDVEFRPLKFNPCPARIRQLVSLRYGDLQFFHRNMERDLREPSACAQRVCNYYFVSNLDSNRY